MEKKKTLQSKFLNQASGIFQLTPRKPVAILMIVIAVCVFGFISYKRLSLNLMPEISYPTITVRTEYEGNGPEEVEIAISRPMEQALGIVSNLVNITSISRTGVSDIIMEFTWDTDMNFISQEIREKFDQVILPEDAQRPIILRYDPTLDPIMRLGVYGMDNLFELRWLAEETIKRELEGISGVAAVKVKGGLEDEIWIEIEEEKLANIGLDITDITRQLAMENINLAGGTLKEGETEYIVRTLNEFKDIDEIGDLVIDSRSGVSIKLRDIATVRDTHKEREVLTRINELESVEIDIYKEADANIVAVAEAVVERIYGTEAQQQFVAKMKMAEEKKAGPEGEEGAGTGKEKRKKDRKEKDGEEKDEEKQKKDMKDVRDRQARQDIVTTRMTDFLGYKLPEGTKIEVLSNQAKFIKDSINEVRNTAILGGILAVFVLYIFLRRFKNTIIIGVAIPISVIATFAPMYLFDVSLNIMSLGGLALGIGMLVDNSIVVLESIFRCSEEGDSIMEAAVRGVQEVGGAVFASTLTTIAVFFPIVFVKGIAGQIFGNQAMTVVFSLLASLLVALFFIPMLASRQVKTMRIPGLASGSPSNPGAGIHPEEEINFLRFNFLSRLRRPDETAETVGKQRFSLSYLYLPFLGIWEFLKKILLLIVAFLCVVLKGAAILLAGLLYLTIIPNLILKFIAKRRSSSETLPDRAVTKSLNRHFFRMKYFTTIWPNLMSFQALEELRNAGNGYRVLWERFTRGGLVMKGLKFSLLLPWFLLLFLVFTFWVILRFFIHLIFALLGKIFVILFTTIAALFIFIGGAIGLVFTAVLYIPIKLFSLTFEAINRLYPRVISFALDSPLAIIFIAALLLAGSLYFILPTIGSELIPQVHQGEFDVEIKLPVGTPLEKTDRVIQRIEKRILDLPGVAKVATAVGVDRESYSKSDEGENTAKILVSLKPSGQPILQEERTIQQIRETVADIPDIETRISLPAIFSFKTPIEVEARGYNLVELRRVAESVVLALEEIEGLYDVETNTKQGNPEVEIIYNREKLARYGLNIYDVASLVRNKIKGDVATKFRKREKKIDVLVRLQESDKETIANLRQIIINPDAPIPVPLEAVAEVRIKEGPAEIRRIDQQRAALITANISGADLGRMSRRIEDQLRTIAVPEDFAFVLSGQNKEMEVSRQSMIAALILAIFLVYVVMASQFESLIHPFVIMFSIPLAIIGVLLILYITNTPFSVVVYIGMIMLAGIVVNNAIILIDYINQLRRGGMSKKEAIIKAGSVRLRPILMTTSTTVLALLPLALGLGEGAEIRTPMAITVIAGLISSTLLTLVVIPTVYSLLDRGKMEEVQP